MEFFNKLKLSQNFQVYTTEALPHDVTIVGSFKASLKVSTSGTDSDFVVKLIDVYTGDYPNPVPNPKQLEMGGYQQLGAYFLTNLNFLP